MDFQGALFLRGKKSEFIALLGKYFFPIGEIKLASFLSKCTPAS